MTKQQDLLNNRFEDKHANEFEDNWKERPFKYSSWALMFKVTDDEHVIDIGCGTNPFKGKIKNLIGVDPVFVDNEHCAGADVVCPIEEYNTDKLFDVAFCLGSIQFGDEEYISKQVDKVVSLLKPKSRIYWRHRLAGIATHPDDENEVYDDEYFIWDCKNMKEYATKHGYIQVECKNDPNLVTNDKRLYCEWVRD